MYTRVLLAVDGTDSAVAVLPELVRFARAWRSTVRVTHVRRPGPARRGADPVGTVLQLVRRLRAADVVACDDVRPARDDDVAATVAYAAHEFEVDLIALATHGASALATMLTGSVSRDVARAVDMPILLLRPALTRRDGRPPTVLAAVDWTERRPAVLAAAVDAAAGGGEVIVAHVPEGIGERVVYGHPFLREERLVEAATDELRVRGVPARGMVLDPRGRASGRIVLAAERFGADVIVVGSRRLGDLANLAGWSVGDQVARSARGPVLLAAGGGGEGGS